MNYYPKFAELLWDYLSKVDRSPAWLAEKLGRQNSTVTRWLNDKTRPDSPETMIRIADILSVPAAERPAFLHAAGYGYQVGIAPHVPAPHSQPTSDSIATHQSDSTIKTGKDGGDMHTSGKQKVHVQRNRIKTKTVFQAPVSGPIHTGPGDINIFQDELSALKKRLTDPNSNEEDRVQAAQKLGDLQDPKAISTMLVWLREDSDPTARYWLAYGLGQIGKEMEQSGKEKVIAALKVAAETETEPFVRLGIIDGLNELGYPDAISLWA